MTGPRWLTLLVAAVVALALAIPASAAAPVKITHWQMELSLIRQGIEWQDGTTTEVDDAYCAGFGPHLKRPLRFQRFVCHVIGFVWPTACEDPDFFNQHIEDTTCDQTDDVFEGSVRVLPGTWSIERLP